MRERIEAMKAIWAEDEASYSGRYVQFERIWSWPKPAQRPHPPILVGGNGPRVLDRVLAFGDEWMPNPAPVQELVARTAELNSRASEAGRGPVPVTVVGPYGTPAEIEQLDRGGIERLVAWLPPRGKDEVEQAFERFVATAREYDGAGA